MTFDRFLEKKVLAAVRRLAELDKEFFARPDCQAIAMAMAAQESRSRRADAPTLLAAVHHNLFGVKWAAPRDVGRYDYVDLPPNDFETAPQRYRVYDSIEHALVNLRWHLLYSNNYRSLRKPDAEAWLRAIAPVWCDANPKHTEDLVQLLRAWRARLAP